MIIRLSELQNREIINICDGCRVGFVDDAEFDCTGGNIVALVAPGKARFFGLFGREYDYVIPWGCIRRIGTDAILIEADPDKIRVPCRKKKLF